MNTQMTVKLAALALATGLTTLSTAVFAQKAQSGSGDGVVTIDQAKVTSGAVTPGDAAGFPLTISQNGAYRLTGNLVVPAGVNGIEIAAGVDAVIDMNGFSITGPANCSKTISCYDANGTFGIRLLEGATVALARGKVRGFTQAGISDGSAQKSMMRLTDMEFSGNSTGALAMRMMALRVYANGNEMYGIYALRGSIVDSFASNNTIGFAMQVGSVRGNTAFANGSGFALGSVAYQDNAASQNTNGSLYAAPTGPGSNNAF